MADAPTPLILLLDDDPDFVEMNRRVLEGAGYRVVGCHDPADALAAMGRERPALVISDLMMKAFDSGFAFARQVKQDPRFAGVPVILLTSVSSKMGLDFHPAAPADLAAMHADAYLDKPVPPPVLLEKVRALLIAKKAK